MPSTRISQLVVLGIATGIFSGLFGVGGGIVLVPLLVLWIGFDERRAAATSLLAIVIAASAGAAAQMIYGNVDLVAALTVGIPAVGGVLIGTWLQQRIPVAVVQLMFSVMLVAVAALVVFQ
ncbi:MAG: sulfite exporter TauE/SafE family protein [Solirubrobacteraceae bacterium]|nr:sulfite exporter TauE/SafE family protein [Solirubrobacteraceae bacterium]